jgi:hypothetical protein
MPETYDAPALQEIGDFGELTKCYPFGSCTDLCGAQAWICLF